MLYKFKVMKPLNRVFVQFVFLFSFILSFCMKGIIVDGRNLQSSLEGKIVGGSAVPVEKYPFAVQIFNYGALCGGTILSSWAVLTAAHCFDNNKKITAIHIIAGARYLYDMAAQSHDIWYVIVHEDYNKEALFACDIALVFTRRQIKFNEKMQRAIIVNSNKWMNTSETNFTATGWGFTSYGGSMSTSGLMEARLRFVSSAMCNLNNPGSQLTEDMFCLYGDGKRDTCQGDSGGAILWKGQVVGLVSHGDGCAQKEKPGIYTNVYYFLPWMKEKIMEARRKYCNRIGR